MTSLIRDSGDTSVERDHDIERHSIFISYRFMSLVLIFTLPLLSFGTLERITGFRFGVGKSEASLRPPDLHLSFTQVSL